jgi:hypothetical protein
VYLTFRLCQKAEAGKRARAHPVRQGCRLDDAKQLAYVSMGAVVAMRMRVLVARYIAGTLMRTIGKANRDFGGLDACPVYHGRFDRDTVETEALGEAAEPGGIGTGPHEGTEEHIPTHPGRRVDDREVPWHKQ